MTSALSTRLGGGTRHVTHTVGRLGVVEKYSGPLRSATQTLDDVTHTSNISATRVEFLLGSGFFGPTLTFPVHSFTLWSTQWILLGHLYFSIGKNS